MDTDYWASAAMTVDELTGISFYRVCHVSWISLAKIDEKETKSGFKIDEIELAVGINGKGKVGIWGIGAEAGSNASIKLKLKRKS